MSPELRSDWVSTARSCSVLNTEDYTRTERARPDRPSWSAIAFVIRVASLRSVSDIGETAAVSAESPTATATGWQGSGVGDFPQSAAISGLSITSWYSGLSTTC